MIDIQSVFFNEENVGKIRKSFVAFDTETTGLNPMKDRIVELGAVRFENGKPVEKFSTLVNGGVLISPAASRVNHITNEMLFTAPVEEEAYAKFLEFLGDAALGQTIMCAHNASFDFSFLKNTLARLDMDGTLRYVDTLAIARRYLKGLPNYKQCTLEDYYSLHNKESHRAYSDAQMCGQILYNIVSTQLSE